MTGEQLVVFTWKRKAGKGRAPDPRASSHALAPAGTIAAMCGTSVAKPEFWLDEVAGQQRCRTCIEAIGVNYPSSVGAVTAALSEPKLTIDLAVMSERLFGGQVDAYQWSGSILHESIEHALETGALRVTTDSWPLIDPGLSAVERERWRLASIAANLDVEVYDELLVAGHNPRQAFETLMFELTPPFDCCVGCCNACPVCGLHNGFHDEGEHAAREVPEHVLITRVEPERVRLTDDEIAERREAARQRREARS